ncbi:uncharacterized protein LOC108630529 isoform X2 [Ceratina calcarata]|uniref:Regulatory protein zeste n=1 Tax=Ceratina calcarata TaxID=156304 RepID=A0AAJ7S9T2_9HYME|nr:uncharacterized protein LOC108630529 isoform X2 [Ceratina calcarata]
MSSSSTTVLLKKRERTQNWVPEEKNALFVLIKAHVNAIENKKIDAAASAMKTLAWQQIHCAFRGKFSTDRDIARMKEQWRRMKAQARMEMYTFAEKVKTIGPEKAAKCRPSPLSVEVWKLMENARKNDGDADHLDDNGQESTESSTSLQTILDKLTSPAEEVTTVNEIKLEVDSDEYNSEEEASQCELSKRKSNMQKKRRYNFHDEPMNLAEPRTNSTVDIVNHPAVDSSLLSNTREKISSEQEDSTQRSIWMFDVAQREHDLKMRVLNIELERAELQKQTAVNELKTSELKRQLIESQAAEYCSQVRMTGERGSGAGKGGGGGGSIRDAGGSFGKMEAAHEDQYFYNLQKRQIQKLKDDLHDEISFHEEQIKRHQEAINRHKKRITDMSKE